MIIFVYTQSTLCNIQLFEITITDRSLNIITIIIKINIIFHFNRNSIILLTIAKYKK